MKNRLFLFIAFMLGFSAILAQDINIGAISSTLKQNINEIDQASQSKYLESFLKEYAGILDRLQAEAEDAQTASYYYQDADTTYFSQSEDMTDYPDSTDYYESRSPEELQWDDFSFDGAPLTSQNGMFLLTDEIFDRTYVYLAFGFKAYKGRIPVIVAYLSDTDMKSVSQYIDDEQYEYKYADGLLMSMIWNMGLESRWSDYAQWQSEQLGLKPCLFFINYADLATLFETLVPSLERTDRYRTLNKIKAEIEVYCSMALQWYKTPKSVGGTGQNISSEAKKQLVSWLGFDSTTCTLQTDSGIFKVEQVSAGKAIITGSIAGAEKIMGPYTTATIEWISGDIRLVVNPLLED
jgi:hypothetical protein